MRRAVICLVFAIVLACCSGDPNEQANKLLVEAQQLLEKAEKQAPAERLLTVLTAEERLKAIVAKYSASNLAVQLASDQSVGKISLKAVSQQVIDARWAACISAPKRSCVLELAAAAIDSVSKDDGQSLSYALAAMAHFKMKAGQKSEAVKTFNQALHVAQSIKYDWRPSALAAVAEAQMLAGLTSEGTETFDQARRAAESTKDTLVVAGEFSSIARAQIRAGLLKEAASTFDAAMRSGQSGSVFERVDLLKFIASEQAQMGLLDDAIRTVRQAFEIVQSGDNARLRDVLIFRTAAFGPALEAWQGKFSEALASAGNIRNESSRASAYSYIADTFCKKGLTRDASAAFQRAVGSVRSLADVTRDGTLAEIARIQANCSQFGEAKETARLINEVAFRPVEVILEIQAKTDAKAGKILEAMGAAREIKNDHAKRGAALASIAEALRD